MLHGGVNGGVDGEVDGCARIRDGGYIHDQVTITKRCKISNDLTVAEEGVLVVAAGTTLEFEAAVVLGVNGTLIAEGTPDNRIIFTKSSASSSAPPHWPDDVRLVDDHSVHVGRLEMVVKGQWRGVCANNVNWTQTDVDVACRSLGFTGGNFTFGSWARNHTKHALLFKPSCKGSEGSLLECEGAKKVKVGKTVCLHQAVVHLYCRGTPEAVSDYWGGIEFYNTTVYKSNNMFSNLNESTSVLKYVDILYAGLGKDGNALPSLRADPHAPHLRHLTIRHSLLDATNFTNVKSSVTVRNCSFVNNRGHGLAVESHMGHVDLLDNVAEDNYGNGIKVKFLNGRYVVYDKQLTFCEMINLALQAYPLFIIAIPTLGNSCSRKFESIYGHRLTVNVLEMDVEPGVEGWISVHDGINQNSPLIGRYPVINNTLPMGVTSTYQQLFIKFDWSIPPKKHCPSLRTCVKVVLLVDSARASSSPELFINNTRSHNNLQHGFFIENIRNYIVVNASEATNNHYGAGIAVYGGAGDILINSTVIEGNRDNGVNITTEGGWRIFNHTSFSFNWGNGANITMNETSVDNRTRYSRHQRTEVSRCTFIGNLATGLSVGNYCSNALHVVNDSKFIDNNHNGISFLSCLLPNSNTTNFTAAYNIFRGNGRHAIRLSPLANVVGRIANNTFHNHRKYVLLVDNTDDFRRMMYLQSMPVNYEVEANSFRNNSGLYVAFLRLVQGSTKQQLIFRYNELLDNQVEDKNGSLNQRSRSRAVLIVSSENVQIRRNYLYNPASTFEITTHLQDVGSHINATANYWKTTDYQKLIKRIFDQSFRYNLARVLYHPALQYPWLYGPVLTDRDIEVEIEFQRGNVLGGRLSSHLTLPPHSTFLVDRDINVNKYGKLIVEEGTTLEFENGIGMVVEGQIEMKGTTNKPIVMKLRNESTWINQTAIKLVVGRGKEEIIDGGEWMDGRNKDGEGLMDEEEMKDGMIEGWLMVFLNETLEDQKSNGTWGTVCKKGWSDTESSVACQMIGLFHHPEDHPHPSTSPPPSFPILVSDVICTDLDTDLLTCDYEREHSCKEAVYLRCRQPAWSGTHILGKAQAGRMVGVEMSGAGLYDPSIPSLSPALQVDYSVHELSNLHIHHNLQDGIHILKNDPYTTSHVRSSHVHHNLGNGVVVRDSFFELTGSLIEDNAKSGFLYKPSITANEALELRKGVHDYISFDESRTWNVQEYSTLWVMTKPTYFSKHVTYHAQFIASGNFRLLVDIVDYNTDMETEKVSVFDTRLEDIKPHTRKWQVDEDLIDFPVLSQLSVLTLEWKISGMTSGRLSFIVRSRPWEWDLVFPHLHLLNNTFRHNHLGNHLKLFNHPSDEFDTLFHRFNWEKISLEHNHYSHNAREALLITSHTRHNPLYLPSPTQLQETLRVAEVEYRIEGCVMDGNGGGIHAHHPDVGFANSVWIVEVGNSRVEEGRGGGLVVEFPRLNLMSTELFNHSITVNNTLFRDNLNFQVTVGGFYCNSSVSSNHFKNNHCTRSCMTFQGTEKDFEFVDNTFENNYGRSMLEINMHSHTPYTQWVDATVNYNRFKDNHPPQLSLTPTNTPTHPLISTTSPPSYTIAVKGLQNTTINRNLLANPDMPFELLAAQTSSRFENYLDVTENWWGGTDATDIENRIFDFDDWNSHSIAEYSPVLSSASFDSSAIPLARPRKVVDYSRPLGGRVEEFMNLTRRTEPYLIDRDLTIMSGYSMFIEKGVQVRVVGGVGVLVLGAITAFGSPESPISFQPAPPSLHPLKRKNISKRSALPDPSLATKHHDVDQIKGFQLRLVGGEEEDGGFLEVYNSTEQSWSIVCDDAFNDRTAQVACRTMGKESSNALVERSPYYDVFVLGYPKMHDQRIEWFWRETMACVGDEENLNDCSHKINYNLPTCMHDERYVYLRCGPRNLEEGLDYWGGIRFSSLDHAIRQSSFLQHVDLIGAGGLHGDRVAALQSVQKNVDCDHLRIQNSAWNGIDFIAPPDVLSVKNSLIQNNHGYGIGVVVLNGQSWEGESQFTPLHDTELPPSLHGVVSMCSVQKMLLIGHRALLYHKYSFDTIDCIKVFRSREARKQVGVRLLQFNLFNDSTYVNSLQIFEGEFFSPEQLLVTLTYNSSQEELKKLYKVSTFYDTISIRITASPAYGSYGFVAEVVTLPISPGHRSDYGNLRRHIFSGNLISNNLRGGILYRNVGEDSPRVIVERNYIAMCGTKVLNNTEAGSIDMNVQNTRLLTISNNYIVRNAGGIRINTTTKDHQSSLFANITNNIITHTSHAPALHLEGHYFQSFQVQHNHISDNHLAFRNVIYLSGIQVNFTSNVVNKNSAQCIINASVPEKIDTNHRYTYNSIHHNLAHEYARTTFFLKSAKFHLSENFLLNPLNLFDIVTHNRTKYPDGMYPEIQAANNWWGSDGRSYVEGRVWDRQDDDNLIAVNVKPFVKDNSTLLDGKCYPGWRENKGKCYMYYGGVATFDQASLACRAGQGRLAWARDATGKEKQLGDMVARYQFDYSVQWRVWVYSDHASAACTFLKDFKVTEGACSSLLPFICERDPYIQPRMNWVPIIVTIVISTLIILFVIIPLIIFGCIKSSLRRVEKTDRKVTLQRSLAASRQSLDQLEPTYSAINHPSLNPPLLHPAPAYTPSPYKRNYSDDNLKVPPAAYDASSSSMHKYVPSTDYSPSEYESKSKIWSDTSSFASKVSTSKRPRPPLNLPPTLENQVPTLHPRSVGGWIDGEGGYEDGGGRRKGEGVRKRGGEGSGWMDEKRALKYQVGYDDGDEFEDVDDDDHESRV